MNRTFIKRVQGIAALTAGFAAAAAACPACYGNLNSPRTAGMNMAILAMVAITAMVLGGISSFFLAMRKRINILNDHATGNSKISSKGKIEWNNF
jgi:hypothetical protein